MTLTFVNLDGGDATGNANVVGGNLYSSSADLTITGGQITNGKANRGGGIYLLDGAASLDGLHRSRTTTPASAAAGLPITLS